MTRLPMVAIIILNMKLTMLMDLTSTTTGLLACNTLIPSETHITTAGAKKRGRLLMKMMAILVDGIMKVATGIKQEMVLKARAIAMKATRDRLMVTKP